MQYFCKLTLAVLFSLMSIFLAAKSRWTNFLLSKYSMAAHVSLWMKFYEHLKNMHFKPTCIWMMCINQSWNPYSTSMNIHRKPWDISLQINLWQSRSRKCRYLGAFIASWHFIFYDSVVSLTFEGIDSPGFRKKIHSIKDTLICGQWFDHMLYIFRRID